MAKRLAAAAFLGVLLPATGRAEVIDFTTLVVDDPAADPLRVGAVRFFDGELLSAADFGDEQQYRMGTGRGRIVFDSPASGASLFLAAASNGGSDAVFAIEVRPGPCDPLAFHLPALGTRRVDLPCGNILEIDIEALTIAGGPAAFGLRRIEFTASVPEPASLVLVLAGAAALAASRRRPAAGRP